MCYDFNKGYFLIFRRQGVKGTFGVGFDVFVVFRQRSCVQDLPEISKKGRLSQMKATVIIMKKTIAFILVMAMFILALPFAAFADGAVIKVGTAAELAAMESGKSYKLTADVTLDSSWTTIPEFAGTLDGNGYTVTLNTSAPMCDKLTGTVKNVVFKGNVTLKTDDVSKDTLTKWDTSGGGHKYAVGALACQAIGATVEQVKFSAGVTFVQDDKTVTPVAVGAMFGAAVTGADKKPTTIDNVNFNGNLDVRFDTAEKSARCSVGGVVAFMSYNVDISNVLFTGNVSATNCSAYAGGIVGYNYNEGNLDFDVSTLTNCFFNGSVAKVNSSGERAGGLVGYSNGITMLNCAANAQKVTINGNRDSSCCGLLAYGSGGSTHKVLVKNCVDVNSSSRPMCLNNAEATSENNIYTCSGNGIANGKAVNLKQIANANEALSTFATDNSAFTFAEGTLTLTTVSDPVTVPEPVAPNVPTGDMTVWFVVAAMISLAGIAIVSKKKVNE